MVAKQMDIKSSATCTLANHPAVLNQGLSKVISNSSQIDLSNINSHSLRVIPTEGKG